jgi:hypothetical protein
VRLEYVGFHRHREGFVHIYCPKCHLKRSNIPRAKSDPPTAVLVAVFCERCGDGGWVEGPSYILDARGRELCQLCGRYNCDLTGGNRECDELLVGGHDRACHTGERR